MELFKPLVIGENMAGLMGIGEGLSSFMESFNATKDRNLRDKAFQAAEKRQTAQDVMEQNRLKLMQQEQQPKTHEALRKQRAETATGRIGGLMMTGVPMEQALQQAAAADPGFSPADVDWTGVSNIQKNTRPDVKITEVDGQMVAFNPVTNEKQVIGKARGFAPQQAQWAVIEGPDGSTQWIQKGQQPPAGFKIRDSGGVTVNMEPGGGALQKGEIKDLRDRKRVASLTKNSLNNLTKLVDKHGVMRPNNPMNDMDVVTQLNSAYNDTLMQLKEAYALGVLNGPDLEIMQKILKNPVDIPVNPLQARDWKGQVVASANEVQRMLDQRIAAANEELQIVNTPPPPGNVPPPAPAAAAAPPPAPIGGPAPIPGPAPAAAAAPGMQEPAMMRGVSQEALNLINKYRVK